MSILRELRSKFDHFDKLSRSLDDVICGQNEHDGIRIPLHERDRSHRDCGSSVASLGLNNDVVLDIVLPLPELQRDHVRLRTIRHDERTRCRHTTQGALHCLLNQGVITDNAKQLFRIQLPTERPKSSPAAPSENDRK